MTALQKGGKSPTGVRGGKHGKGNPKKNKLHDSRGAQKLVEWRKQENRRRTNGELEAPGKGKRTPSKKDRNKAQALTGTKPRKIEIKRKGGKGTSAKKGKRNDQWGTKTRKEMKMVHLRT